MSRAGSSRGVQARSWTT